MVDLVHLRRVAGVAVLDIGEVGRAVPRIHRAVIPRFTTLVVDQILSDVRAAAEPVP